MRKSVSVLKKCILIVLGTISLALGLLGIVVRLLPTTPLLLLGSWCYVRSCERLHQRLIQSSLYIRYVDRFYRKGGLTLQAKCFLLAWVWLLIVILYMVADSTSMKGVAILLGIGKTLFFILVVKTLPRDQSTSLAKGERSPWRQDV